MKFILFAIMFLVASGCATSMLEFDKDINCSPRAIAEYKNEKSTPSPVNISAEESARKAEKLQKILKSLVSRANTCYQDSLAATSISGGRQVCVVLTVAEKGNLSFIDVQDQANPIPKDLKDCLIDLISGADYRSVPSVTALQPFRFHVSKK